MIIRQGVAEKVKDNIENKNDDKKYTVQHENDNAWGIYRKRNTKIRVSPTVLRRVLAWCLFLC